jgi:DNA-binding GntR family transcriptional regulator
MSDVAVHADAAMYLRKNQEFHFTIYSAAKSGVLMSLIESLWLQAGPFIAQTFTRDGVKGGLEKHALAVEAFRRGDAKAAMTAIERDIGEAADWLLGNFPFEAMAPVKRRKAT